MLTADVVKDVAEYKWVWFFKKWLRQELTIHEFELTSRETTTLQRAAANVFKHCKLCRFKWTAAADAEAGSEDR